MKAVVRAVALAGLAVMLQQCGGQALVGCPQIAQKSTGPCRVGLPPNYYTDDAWRQQ
ncbi:MAG: hypothetical protein HY060_11335 [Proteobacteria bacterium]|nr:hypothetical protein [Pseudomonadota bacterium]